MHPNLLPTKSPRPHQQEAITDVVNGFRTHERGQFISACGTGKTLTCLWVAEALGAEYVLILAPSLSLVAQNLKEWRANARVPFRALVVCSDKTVRGYDEVVIGAEDIDTPVTTDETELQDELAKGPCYVFATYQSSGKVKAAMQDGAVRPFDLVIADEAHRCAANKDSDFATVLDPQAIKSQKRLFTTATPRITEDDTHGYSMDSLEHFGPVFHRLTFGKAVEQGLLAGYRFHMVGISDAQCSRDLKGITDRPTIDAVRNLAAILALSKAVTELGLKKVISFHGRIKSAKAFAQAFQDEHQGLCRSEHIFGEMPSSTRVELLRRLADPPENGMSLLSNARCLSEGIDVPSLDGVIFVDPRGSQTDIVQAVGRVMRKAEGKTHGTIIVPVLVLDGERPEDAIVSSRFATIWAVLNALKDHDERLAHALTQLKAESKDDPTAVALPSHITIDTVDLGALGVALRKHIELRVIGMLGDSWMASYELCKAFVHEFKRAPKENETFKGFSIGTWCSRQRWTKAALALSAARVHLLDALPGWDWEPQARPLRESRAFVQTYGSLELLDNNYVSPTGFALGNYMQVLKYHIRTRARRTESGHIWDLMQLPGFSLERRRMRPGATLYAKWKQWIEQGNPYPPQGHPLSEARTRLLAPSSWRRVAPARKALFQALPGFCPENSAGKAYREESDLKFHRKVAIIQAQYAARGLGGKISQWTMTWICRQSHALANGTLSTARREALEQHEWWRERLGPRIQENRTQRLAWLRAHPASSIPEIMQGLHLSRRTVEHTLRKFRAYVVVPGKGSRGHPASYTPTRYSVPEGDGAVT